MKNALDGLISRLDTADEKRSDLEKMTIETSKREKRKKKTEKITMVEDTTEVAGKI
jgi:hypothetical protein